MNDLTKLFTNVVQDFRELDGAVDLANKSTVYLSKKKEWSFGDYVLIGFNVLNIGFRGYKTINDTDKFIAALSAPKPVQIQIPAKLHFPTRKITVIHRKPHNLNFKRKGSSN